jgi:hypothetical protein
VTFYRKYQFYLITVDLVIDRIVRRAAIVVVTVAVRVVHRKVDRQVDHDRVVVQLHLMAYAAHRRHLNPI